MRNLHLLILSIFAAITYSAVAQTPDPTKIRILDTRPAKETGGYKIPNSTVKFHKLAFVSMQEQPNLDVLILDMDNPIKIIDGAMQLLWTPSKKIIITNCPYYLNDIVKNFWLPQKIVAEGKRSETPGVQIERYQVRNGNLRGATFIRVYDPASAQANEGQKRVINDRLIQQILLGN